MRIGPALRYVTNSSWLAFQQILHLSAIRCLRYNSRDPREHRAAANGISNDCRAGLKDVEGFESLKNVKARSPKVRSKKLGHLCPPLLRSEIFLAHRQSTIFSTKLEEFTASRCPLHLLPQKRIHSSKWSQRWASLWKTVLWYKLWNRWIHPGHSWQGRHHWSRRRFWHPGRFLSEVNSWMDDPCDRHTPGIPKSPNVAGIPSP